MATNEQMKVVVTKVGLAKITEATIENPLRLTHFAVGDGGGNPIEPNQDMTSLVNEKYRDFLNDTYANENNLSIECVLRANAPITTGFKIFELGIFDADGDMIAISQTPEQYRPSNSEGVATEWIASVVLQLSNTDNITIEIPETVFATTDALQRLLERVKTIEINSKKLIDSCVGIEKHFNTNNKYKDQDILQIGVKTYGLAGSIVKISDYPTAFKNCGAVDRGDGTFEIPKFFDGTIRHLEKGNPRELGTFETDDFKAHTHTTPDHIHGIADIKGDLKIAGNGQGFADSISVASGAFKKIVETLKKSFATASSAGNSVSFRFSSHEAGVTATNSGGAGNTGSIGGTETRMKNTSGQWYMLLKIVS